MNIKEYKFLLLGLLFIGCSQVTEISEDKFIGVWDLRGRGMFEGIQIRIERQSEKLVGKIVKLNDNKLVTMFTNIDDIWVSDIKRSSNFEFKLTEKKIARDLFSLYGLPTSQEFKVEFIDDNTIGLAGDGSDPQHASIIYKRVQ